MNIYIIKKTLLMVLLGTNLTLMAQNWAIKPFIGYHANTVDITKNQSFNLPYGFTSTHIPITYTYGLILSYQFNPKWGAEVSYKRTPTSIFMDVSHPFTGDKIGSFYMLRASRTLSANINYAFFDNQKWIRLKGFIGLELMRKAGSWTDKSASGNYVQDTTLTYAIEDNKRKLAMINLGFGTEFLVNRKPIAELRLTTGIGYRYYFSTTAKIEYLGYTYENIYSTTGTYLNTILILNLNTVFSKWWKK